MKRILLIFSCFLSLSSIGQELEITYIANEGVLLEKGAKKVLIDAIFDGYFDDYLHPSDRLREDMTEGISPYNDVDVVLVTHRHRDHFETQATGKFLKAHEESTLLSNYQVADSLKLDYDDFRLISSRVIGHDRTLLTIEKEINDIKIISFFIEHAGGRRDPPAENLCYIIDFDGQSVLHLGDADMDFERFEQLNLSQYEIDIALIPYWYMSDRTGREILSRIEAINLVGIHFPRAPSPMAYQEIKKNYPNGFIFREQFEKLKF